MNENIIVSIFLSIVAIAMSWRFLAISIAGRHRLKIIDYVYETKRYHEHFHDYQLDVDSVTFDQHVNAVYIFKSPWKLYKYGDEYKAYLTQG